MDKLHDTPTQFDILEHLICLLAHDTYADVPHNNMCPSEATYTVQQMNQSIPA